MVVRKLVDLTHLGLGVTEAEVKIYDDLPVTADSGVSSDGARPGPS